MAKIKTDWDIVRGLADYIMTFGEYKHEKFGTDGKKFDGYSPSDKNQNNYIYLYIDGAYVNATLVIKGITKHEFVCFESTFAMPDLHKGQNLSDLPVIDVKEMNRDIRRFLRPMEANRENLLKELNKAKLAELKAEQKAIMDKIKGLK